LSNSPFNDQDHRRKRVKQVAQAYRAAHEVVSGAMSLGLMVLAGYWLDRKYGWSPVLTVCGALLGFVVAGLSFRQLLRRLDRESARNKQR
jgi:F0F1-type ATP synthase assembly protein I